MNKRILAIALPSIVANITTPLLGLVDTSIVGHMGSAVYIGAIAVGGVMFNMLYWLFGFLRGGTSGLAAQAFGSSDTRRQTLVLYRSMMVALTVGIAMVILQWPLLLLLKHFVDPDPTTGNLAARYFRILIFGAPAVLSTYALSGWFLGMQNSRMLMITSIVINLTNIAISLTLVYAFKWQIEGVATGSLVAQWVGFGVALLLLRKYKVVRVSISDVLQPEQLKSFFRINIEVMLRTVCLIAVTLWFTKSGARQGPTILAVNTLLMQLFLLFSYMMDGFAYAGEAMVGKYVGARQWNTMQQCLRCVFGWGIVLATIFTAFYFLLGEAFLGILSADTDVIKAAGSYYWWAAIVPFAGFAAFAWDGVFLGATLTRELLVSMCVAMSVFFILFHFLFPSMGNHALWLAFIAYLLMRGAMQTWLFFRHKFV